MGTEKYKLDGSIMYIKYIDGSVCLICAEHQRFQQQRTLWGQAYGTQLEPSKSSHAAARIHQMLKYQMSVRFGYTVQHMCSCIHVFRTGPGIELIKTTQ